MPLAAALRQHLIQQFPADRAYDRVAIYADAMPPLVAAFLDQTLDRWTDLERARLRSDWFDFEDDEVREAEARLFDALGTTARVPATAWESTLSGAVDLVVRFLTIPARALTDAAFEGEPHPLPVETIRERLDLFAAYPYLTDAAEVALRDRTGDLLPDDVFALLDLADRKAVRGYGPDEWVTLLAPLFDLARLTELGGVPVSALRDFFEAKGEDALADRVSAQAETVLDEAALLDVLASEDGGQKAASSEQKAEEGTAVVDDEPVVEQGAVDEAPVPLWQRFAQDSGDGSVHTRLGDSTPSIEPADEPPLWQTLAAPRSETSSRPAAPSAESLAPKSVGSSALDELEERVLGRTSSGQRSRFVEHLFRGDAGKYVTVLHALDEASSWTEASQVIARDVFRPFKVNIYGEHAVAFTDAVEARFRG